MKIIVEIQHPAHVHHFKYMIWNLKKKGHEIKICAADKEVALHLLNAYGFKYKILGVNRDSSLMTKIPFLIKSEYNLLKVAWQFKPDLFISRISPCSANISKLMMKPHVVFNDTEHSSIVNLLVFPFTDIILTPSCFKKELGKKQVRYNGYHELAYLHPDYFKPNPKVLNELNLSMNDKFIILRFVAWRAAHDIKQKGFDLESKIRLVREMEKYAKVFITSESPLNSYLEKYRIRISPEKMHDLLYYAAMYIGEGATMASECAVLGTPALYVNTLRSGLTDEEEEKYKLLFNFSDPVNGQQQAIDKAMELIKKSGLKQEWREKRKKLLKDKIDVTKFMTEFIENYPESSKAIKENLKIPKMYGKEHN